MVLGLLPSTVSLGVWDTWVVAFGVPESLGLGCSASTVSLGAGTPGWGGFGVPEPLGLG